LQLVRKLRPGIELPSELWVFFTLDSKGALWLHTYPTGVIILDGEHFSKRTTLTVSDGLPHNDIRAIYEERNGDVWIGGLDGGIAVYRRTGNGYAMVRKLVSGAGLDHDEVRAVYLDSLGRCWTGTRWGGITLTDGTTWRTLSTSDGLLSNAVFSIAADPQGTVWIGTHLGLQGIDARSFRVTKTIPGLVGENIGSCGIAGDIVWAFTPKFLATYDLRNAQTNTTPPLISIKEFRVNGTRRPAAQELELSHDENNVTVDFAGISLKNEKGVRYQYRLLGAEEDWSTPTPYRVVTYGALEDGAYTFEVHAVNSDGVQSVGPASVTFTVLPPIWRRWWFQLGIVIVVGSILWAVHKSRVAKLLEIERTRLRIARDLHDEIGSTLSSISYFAQAVRSGGASNTDRLLSLIAESSSKAKGAISDIIWSIDPSNDNWEDLLARMRRHASDVIESKGIRYSIDLPETLAGHTPTMQQRRHLWLLFKELVTNTAQHSHCTHAEIAMTTPGRDIELIVRDDGIGFDMDTVSRGTGLKSLHDRANALGAAIKLDTEPGKGTQWSLVWSQ
jgi:methionine-rich copper-binding protein CopC